ncbi:uncharacterized protein A4U43_C07F15900 [Asparagus officinalis]|uniref:Uncharacterized protein n=1 Tax=Asparagus officinalis TaxID=4686 RepID=A0A5P1ECG6_ASPOF|nr:uncharacterized protein A4U43_C07F15900 [Asparagus officinalis]
MCRTSGLVPQENDLGKYMHHYKLFSALRCTFLSKNLLVLAILLLCFFFLFVCVILFFECFASCIAHNASGKWYYLVLGTGAWESALTNSFTGGQDHIISHRPI